MGDGWWVVGVVGGEHEYIDVWICVFVFNGYASWYLQQTSSVHYILPHLSLASSLRIQVLLDWFESYNATDIDRLSTAHT